MQLSSLQRQNNLAKKESPRKRFGCSGNEIVKCVRKAKASDQAILIQALGELQERRSCLARGADSVEKASNFPTDAKGSYHGRSGALRTVESPAKSIMPRARENSRTLVSGGKGTGTNKKVVEPSTSCFCLSDMQT